MWSFLCASFLSISPACRLKSLDSQVDKEMKPYLLLGSIQPNVVECTSDDTSPLVLQVKPLESSWLMKLNKEDGSSLVMATVPSLPSWKSINDSWLCYFQWRRSKATNRTAWWRLSYCIGYFGTPCLVNRRMVSISCFPLAIKIAKATELALGPQYVCPLYARLDKCF